jgi:hypothetical protein
MRTSQQFVSMSAVGVKRTSAARRRADFTVTCAATLSFMSASVGYPRCRLQERRRGGRPGWRCARCPYGLCRYGSSELRVARCFSKRLCSACRGNYGDIPNYTVSPRNRRRCRPKVCGWHGLSRLRVRGKRYRIQIVTFPSSHLPRCISRMDCLHLVWELEAHRGVANLADR